MVNKNKPGAGLQREIGKLGFSAIVLNGMIGAGIFALPAVAAANTGLFSPWMFVICGLLIMTVVLSMARAASFFSGTGGPNRSTAWVRPRPISSWDLPRPLWTISR